MIYKEIQKTNIIMQSLSTKAYIPKSKIENIKRRKENKMSEIIESDEEIEADAEEVKAFNHESAGTHFENKKLKKQIDTNVIVLNLSTLNLHKGLATGDPIKCQQCTAYLNRYSTAQFEPDKSCIWSCDFCGHVNKLLIEKEEIPKVDEITYILQKDPKAEIISDCKDPIIIICLDISGSMDNKLNSDSKTKYNKNESATRLSCVKLAIEKLLIDASKTTPKAKVGFVTFEDEVIVWGDGEGKPFTVDHSTFTSMFTIIEKCVNQSELFVNPIGKTVDSLLHQLSTIKTGGCTALGPGLTASIAVAAKGGIGSKVILCTDGLANRGIGSVEAAGEEAQKSASDFYDSIGNYAKEHGVVVSLVSIVESECKLDLISPAILKSGGELTKIDPMHIGSDFKDFLSERVLAMNVEVRIRVHKAMEFRNIQDGKLEENGAVLVKNIGNVTEYSSTTFEYKVKATEELAKQEIDLEKIKNLPFQAVISYTSADGLKCLKILSILQEVSNEKREAEKEINEKVLVRHANCTTAILSNDADYENAMMNAMCWNKYSKSNQVQRATEKICTEISHTMITGKRDDDLATGECYSYKH